MMDRSLTGEQLSDLIGRIYDCVLEKERWSGTIERVREQLNFGYVVLGLYPLVPGEITLGVSSGLEPARLSELTALGEDIVELWGGHARVSQFPLEEPIVQSEAVTEAALQASRFFTEWAQPQGIIDAVAVGLERNARMVSTLSFGRHADAGPLGRDEIDSLRLLAPHFRRAIAISRLLELRSVMAQNASSVIETLSTPVLLVDALMSLIHANAAGHTLLSGEGTMRLRHGRIEFLDGSTAVARAVAAAARDETWSGRRGGAGLPAYGKVGRHHVVHVLPLPARSARGNLFRHATAALFVTEPDRAIDLPVDAFAALYGLTPAEARIANLVIAGSSPSDVAERLGLRVSTVRTHLLHAFDKTGVRGQADLVRLAASFSAFR